MTSPRSTGRDDIARAAPDGVETIATYTLALDQRDPNPETGTDCGEGTGAGYEEIKFRYQMP